jgi:SAM-dependent methyltransferase/uncharacterized protein YbaR (Trm112 family)
MRKSHLDELALICPACRAQDRGESALALGTVLRADGDDVIEGALVCGHPSCRREHPIVDGIPVVVSNLANWAQHQLDAVLRRTDLSPWMTSLLGDAAGPGTVLDDERRNVSTYATAHYASDSYETLARTALALAPPRGVCLDVGCAVGRGTFELARAGATLAVGIDLSFAMLLVAERARRTGVVRFEQRQLGLVYAPRELPAPPTDRVAFVCADVHNLPVRAADHALAINVVDCVADPAQHLAELARVVRGDVVLATPYDWTANATPLAAWLGGHSQRGELAGSPEATLRHVLPTLGLHIIAERDRVPWHLYVHARSTMQYEVHVVHARRG